MAPKRLRTHFLAPAQNRRLSSSHLTYLASKFLGTTVLAVHIHASGTGGLCVFQCSNSYAEVLEDAPTITVSHSSTVVVGIATIGTR